MADRNDRRTAVVDADASGHRAIYFHWLACIEGLNPEVQLLGTPPNLLVRRVVWALKLVRIGHCYQRIIFSTAEPFLHFWPLMQVTGVRTCYLVHRTSRFVRSSSLLVRWYRRGLRATILVVDHTQISIFAAAFPRASVVPSTHPHSPALLASPASSAAGATRSVLTVGVIGGKRSDRCLDVLVEALGLVERRKRGLSFRIVRVNPADTDEPGPWEVRRVDLQTDHAYLRQVAEFDVFWAVKQDPLSYFASTVIEAATLGTPVLTQANAWALETAKGTPLIEAVDVTSVEVVADALSRLVALDGSIVRQSASALRTEFHPRHFMARVLHACAQTE